MLVHCRFAPPSPVFCQDGLTFCRQYPRTLEHKSTTLVLACQIQLVLHTKLNNFFFYIFPLFQVLALNRGEQNKILTVKLIIPKHVENQFLSHLHKTWVPADAPGR